MALLRGIQKALFSMALPYGFAVTPTGCCRHSAGGPAGAELGSADQPALGGMLHVLAVGASLGAAALLAQISSWLAWPLAYLLVSGAAIGILALKDD